MSQFWGNDDELQHDLLFVGFGSFFFFLAFERDLPPVFTRRTASEAIGGLMSPKTFSNLDALGQGPPKVQLGSRVGYERESFIRWLRVRIRSW